MLDFTPVRNKTLTYSDLCRDLTKVDLHRLTDEMMDTMLAIIADAKDEDVDFVPLHPDASDTFGIPEEKDLACTLVHGIVQATAASEESPARERTRARGLTVEGRARL